LKRKKEKKMTMLNDSVLQALQNERLIHFDLSSGEVSYYNQPTQPESKKRTKRTEGKGSQKKRCVEASAPKLVIDLDPQPQEEAADKPSNEIEVILETTVPESDELPATGSVWFLELEHLLKDVQKTEPSPSPSPVKQKNTKSTKRRKNNKRQLFGESEHLTSITSSPPLSPNSSAPILLSPSSPIRFDSNRAFSAFTKLDDDLKRNPLSLGLPSIPPLGNLYSSLATLNMLTTPSAFATPASSLYPLLSPFGLPTYPFVSPFYYGPSSLLYFNGYQASQ